MSVREAVIELAGQHLMRPGGQYPPITFHPDGSWHFDDLILLSGVATGRDSSTASLVGGFMLHRRCVGARRDFENGGLSTLNYRNNSLELDYVAEGPARKLIDGVDCVLNTGDLVLINRDVNNAHYLDRRDTAVLGLCIANAFFDAARGPAGGAGRDLLQAFVTGRERNYRYIRFTPKVKEPRVPGFLEKILQEMREGERGSEFFIMGYVERVLSALPREYDGEVVWSREDGGGAEAAGTEKDFDALRRYLEEHYRDASLKELRREFGRGINYYNEVIKRHTGMTYSGYVKNIRLDHAGLLLKTTGLPVEEIARRVGYENLSFFYRIFEKKFLMTPRELRGALGGRESGHSPALPAVNYDIAPGRGVK